METNWNSSLDTRSFINSSIPDHYRSRLRSGEIETIVYPTGEFLFCKSVTWHKDLHIECPICVLLVLVNEGYRVETKTITFSEQEPGSVIVFDLHKLHRCRAINGTKGKLFSAFSLLYPEYPGRNRIEKDLIQGYPDALNDLIEAERMLKSLSLE
jgi:hypothetical protein